MSAEPASVRILVCRVISKLSRASGRTETGAGTTEVIRVMCCSALADATPGAALTMAAAVAATVSPASSRRRGEWVFFTGPPRVEPEWQGPTHRYRPILGGCRHPRRGDEQFGEMVDQPFPGHVEPAVQIGGADLGQRPDQREGGEVGVDRI